MKKQSLADLLKVVVSQEMVEETLDSTDMVEANLEETEMEEPMVEVDDKVQTLEQLKSIVSSTEEYSEVTAKVVRLSFESVVVDLGLEKDKVLSLESLDTREGTISLLDRWITCLK